MGTLNDKGIVMAIFRLHLLGHKEKTRETKSQILQLLVFVEHCIHACNTS
jgi:hypothetical protein